MTAITGYIGEMASRGSANYETGMRMTGEAAPLVENLSGRWAERTYRGDVFAFSVTGVTIPVVANNLVSVCGIYNPPGSGKLLEIIDTHLPIVLATTVVNHYGWYSSTVALSAGATFTTAGTAKSRRLEDAAGNVARVYSAVTHSGTPTLQAIIGGHGATTSAGLQIKEKFDGTLIVPQGVLMSIAASTAASTSSGMAAMFTWAEIPA